MTTTCPAETRRRIRLPDAPRGADGHPIGSPCRSGCHRPSPSQAHCPVCHWSFTGAATFDRHRVGGECLDPAGLGLTELGGLWSTPEGHASRAAFADRTRQRASVQLSDAYGDGPEPSVRGAGPGDPETTLFELQDGAA